MLSIPHCGFVDIREVIKLSMGSRVRGNDVGSFIRYSQSVYFVCAT
jgi:hypothetical protein